MAKYKIEEPIQTADFWYDSVGGGGYIKPEKIYTDEARAAEIRKAMDTLEGFYTELLEDGMLEEI